MTDLNEAEANEQLLVQISAELNGKEWSPDTLEEIARLMRSHGWVIGDVTDAPAAVEVCGLCGAATPRERCTEYQMTGECRNL